MAGKMHLDYNRGLEPEGSGGILIETSDEIGWNGG